MASEQLKAVCVPGRHIGPVVGTFSEGGTTPDGWRLVPASLKGPPGQRRWYHNPDSKAKILICPDHSIEGEEVK